MSDIRIPTRFEHILQSSKLNATPLIIPVEEDLRAFDGLRRRASIQQGGVLAFLTGDSGIGKTTSVWSAASSMAELFEPVLPVPHDVPVREVAAWLKDSLPAQSDRSLLVLFDGREVSDDEVGVRQMLASLNQTLRSRSDIVACWPTTNPAWLAELVGLARDIGGDSLTPAGGVVTIQGPAKSDWIEVLNRLLIQFDQRRDDLALDERLLLEFIDSASTVGDFLVKVRDAIAERVDEVQLARHLPRLLFVVTSVSEVVGEANRLRRAGTLVLKAEELLGYSPRSSSGLWWKARLTDPRHHLAYIISLFQARLATMTPSSVGYAIAEFGPDDLRQKVKTAGLAKSTSNADRTFKNTDFYRFLAGTTEHELTSSTKGQTAASTLDAYAAVQETSAKRHKAINQAICGLAERNVPDFHAALGRYEVDLGSQQAYTDAVVGLDDLELHLEFHHLSQAHCKAASISAYIMDKLQTYAVQYNLVPR